jgi:hypothetical protein
MTPAEFYNLKEYVLDRWGRSNPEWANAERFAHDYEEVPDDAVWAAINLHLDSDRVMYAPRAMKLLGDARRIVHEKALPSRRVGEIATKADPLTCTHPGVGPGGQWFPIVAYHDDGTRTIYCLRCGTESRVADDKARTQTEIDAMAERRREAEAG